MYSNAPIFFLFWPCRQYLCGFICGLILVNQKNPINCIVFRCWDECYVRLWRHNSIPWIISNKIIQCVAMWLFGWCLCGQPWLAVATEIQSKLFTAMQILPTRRHTGMLSHIFIRWWWCCWWWHFDWIEFK